MSCFQSHVPFKINYHFFFFFNHLNRLDSITAMRAKLNIERLNAGSDRRDVSPVSAQTEGNTFRVEEKSIKIKLNLTTKQP